MQKKCQRFLRNLCRRFLWKMSQRFLRNLCQGLLRKMCQRFLWNLCQRFLRFLFCQRLLRNGWTDGRTVRRLDIWTAGRMVGRSDSRTDGPTVGRSDARTNGRSHGRSHGQLYMQEGSVHPGIQYFLNSVARVVQYRHICTLPIIHVRSFRTV